MTTWMETWVDSAGASAVPSSCGCMGTRIEIGKLNSSFDVPSTTELMLRRERLDCGSAWVYF